MLIIKFLSGLAFIGSVMWFLAAPDYEPAVASITSLTAFIAVFFSEKKAKRRAAQSQSIGENGIGIQAGGNVSVGNLHASREQRDAE